jgi:hypothetical protein
MSLLFKRQHTMFSVFRQQDGVPYIDIVPHGAMNDRLFRSAC